MLTLIQILSALYAYPPSFPLRTIGPDAGRKWYIVDRNSILRHVTELLKSLIGYTARGELWPDWYTPYPGQMAQAPVGNASSGSAFPHLLQSVMGGPASSASDKTSKCKKKGKSSEKQKEESSATNPNQPAKTSGTATANATAKYKNAKIYPKGESPVQRTDQPKTKSKGKKKDPNSACQTEPAQQAQKLQTSQMSQKKKKEKGKLSPPEQRERTPGTTPEVLSASDMLSHLFGSTTITPSATETQTNSPAKLIESTPQTSSPSELSAAEKIGRLFAAPATSGAFAASQSTNPLTSHKHTTANHTKPALQKQASGQFLMSLIKGPNSGKGGKNGSSAPSVAKKQAPSVASIEADLKSILNVPSSGSAMSAAPEQQREPTSKSGVPSYSSSVCTEETPLPDEAGQTPEVMAPQALLSFLM